MPSITSRANRAPLPARTLLVLFLVVAQFASSARAGDDPTATLFPADIDVFVRCDLHHIVQNRTVQHLLTEFPIADMEGATPNEVIRRVAVEELATGSSSFLRLWFERSSISTVSYVGRIDERGGGIALLRGDFPSAPPGPQEVHLGTLRADGLPDGGWSFESEAGEDWSLARFLPGVGLLIASDAALVPRQLGPETGFSPEAGFSSSRRWIDLLAMAPVAEAGTPVLVEAHLLVPDELMESFRRDFLPMITSEPSIPPALRQGAIRLGDFVGCSVLFVGDTNGDGFRMTIRTFFQNAEAAGDVTFALSTLLMMGRAGLGMLPPEDVEANKLRAYLEVFDFAHEPGERWLDLRYHIRASELIAVARYSETPEEFTEEDALRQGGVIAVGFISARERSRTAKIQGDLRRIDDANRRYALDQGLAIGDPLPSLEELVRLGYLANLPKPPIGDPYVQADQFRDRGAGADPAGYPSWTGGTVWNERVHPDLLE